MVLVLVLLLKFSALAALLGQGEAGLLPLAPWLARSSLPLLFLTTPYARPGGLGQAIAEHLPARSLPWVLGGVSAWPWRSAWPACWRCW